MTQASAKEAENILRQRLSGWPLFAQSHNVFARDLPHGLSLGYRALGGIVTDENAHLDINTEGPTLYLLSIAIPTLARGRGLGRQLYAIVEDVARDIGCSEVSMTPSGTTARGESRTSYMQRLGYTRCRDGVVKQLGARP